jgi:hypothetical protein
MGSRSIIDLCTRWFCSFLLRGLVESINGASVEVSSSTRMKTTLPSKLLLREIYYLPLQPLLLQVGNRRRRIREPLLLVISACVIIIQIRVNQDANTQVSLLLSPASSPFGFVHVFLHKQVSLRSPVQHPLSLGESFRVFVHIPSHLGFGKSTRAQSRDWHRIITHWAPPNHLILQAFPFVRDSSHH